MTFGFTNFKQLNTGKAFKFFYFNSNIETKIVKINQVALVSSK